MNQEEIWNKLFRHEQITNEEYVFITRDSKMDLKIAWEKFNNGDPISNDELQAMINQCVAADIYFKDRGIDKFYLAYVENNKTMDHLELMKSLRNPFQSYGS